MSPRARGRWRTEGRTHEVGGRRRGLSKRSRQINRPSQGSSGLLTRGLRWKVQLFSDLEKLIPEAIEFVRTLSLRKRLLILLALVGGSGASTAAYKYRESILGLLRTKTEQPIYLFLLVALVSTLLVPGFLLYRKLMARRSLMLRFAETWLQYKELLELLMLEIDVYLLDQNDQNKNLSLNKLLPGIKEYHQQRSKLREMLFFIGEGNLAITKNHHWQELKTEYEIFKSRDYQTPFSFLVDLGNPVAATNLHGKEIGEAVAISDQFIEYLSYKHKGIRALKQKQRVARQLATPFTIRSTLQNVQVKNDCLSVDLNDGRTLSVPLAWYPRLMHGTDAERQNWRFIGDNEGIHWPDLDEDISVENLLLASHPARVSTPSSSG